MQINRNLPSRTGRRNEGDYLPFRGGREWANAPWPASDPLGWLLQMQDEMDATMRRFLPASANRGEGAWGTFAPRMDVTEDDNEYCIEADLPGVKQDNIQIEVRNGMLNLCAEMRHESSEEPGQKDTGMNRAAAGGAQTSGASSGEVTPQNGQTARRYHLRERQYGYMERSFALPEDVDPENIRADFKDGVLTLHLPKKETQKAAARQIPIGQSAMGASPEQNEPQAQSQKQNEQPT